MTLPIQPGWYDDPDGSPAAERRWDGHNWTTERRRKAMQPAPPSAYFQYASQQQAYPQYAQQQPAYPQPPQASGLYSQPAQQSAYPQPPYPPQGQAPYASATTTSNLFSIIAFVCAGISLLFFPVIFGLAGLVLGAVGLTKKERFAPIAIAAAAGGMIAGFVLGMVFAFPLLY